MSGVIAARAWPTCATSYVVGPQQYTPAFPGFCGAKGFIDCVRVS